MTISFIAQNTVAQTFVTGWTINKPTGTAEGDLLIASLCYGGTSTTVTPPSGFTETQRSTFNTRVHVSYQKIAGASEPSSYTFTLSTAVDGAHQISAFRGVDATTPIYAVQTASLTATVDIVGSTVTTTQNNDWLIMLAADNNSNTLGVPSGMTMRAEVFAGTPFARVWIASEARATAGATGTRTATTGGASVDSNAQTFALKEAGTTSAFVTNRGLFLALQCFVRNTSPATTFYVALVTSASSPTVDTNTLSDLTEIAAGNGYTSGGAAVARNSTDWDTLTEDDTNDWALALIKDVVFSASGALPASGNPIRYAVLTTDEATIANRQVIAVWGLGPDAALTAGQALRLVDLQLKGAR